ncbi:hypothetical protein [Tautonia rosea]|uniref:hypothetical protein n=1 Tax=Tautonia rosea TaxID=2728037 RepID=UPI00147348AA|nr:hypothetical protein [Tautonia rosea]
MNQPDPTSFRIVLVILVALASMANARAREQGRAADPKQESLSPDQFDLIWRTLDGIQDELKSAEPDLAADALRGRLLIEAYQLINNVMRTGLSEQQLLRLPNSLKQDAGRLVSLVLRDDSQPPEPSEPDQGPLLIDDPSVPVRLRPFQPILTEVLTDRFEQLNASNLDQARLRETLEREAIAMAAKAVSPSNDPRDLISAERDYVLAMVVERLGGTPGPTDDAEREADVLLQDELDSLFELLRRKNAEWKISGEWPGISDRIEQLEQFGIARLEDVVHLRDPEASIPIPVREQIRAMAELIARGIPVALLPETTPPPDEPSTPNQPTAPDGPSATEEPPRVEPFELALEQFHRLARLARAVDQGLIVAGIDLLTRRSTLRKYFREHAARISGRTAETLPSDFLEAVDREVERILAEHSRAIDPGHPPLIVQPPVVTVPPIITVPTTARPTQVSVPNRVSRWCVPWN